MNDVTITLSSNGAFNIYMDSKDKTFDREEFMKTQEAKELMELAKLAFARMPEFCK